MPRKHVDFFSRNSANDKAMTTRYPGGGGGGVYRIEKNNRGFWGLERPPATMTVRHGQTALHTKIRVKKGKLFSQYRNTFHMESLIWVSDKAENASQSIYNPLAPGPQTPSHNGSATREDGPDHQKKQ